MDSIKEKIKKPEKWLWLEDELSTVDDISILKPIRKIHPEKITTLMELVERIIEIKNSNTDDLSNYGVILDIMIQGTPYIDIPKEWSGKEYEAVPTNNGYDAGIVFAEKFILNMFEQSNEEKREFKPLWNPPPPILFLTIMSSESKGTQKRLNDIKRKWAKYNGVSIEEAKVTYIRKFDATNQIFNDLFNKWFGGE